MAKITQPNKWIQHLLKPRKPWEWRRPSNYLSDWYGLSEAELQLARDVEQAQAKYSLAFSEKVLLKLFHFLRKQPDFEWLENDIWPVVIRLNSAPLPVEVALALAEESGLRYSIVKALANSFQELPVYWLLADQDKYARSRLLIRLFVEEQYSITDLKAFLDRYGLEGAVRILTNRQPDREEKYGAFPLEIAESLKQQRRYSDDPEQNRKQRKNQKRNSIYRERGAEEQRIQKLKGSEEESD